jgi:flagellar FliL protein
VKGICLKEKPKERVQMADEDQVEGGAQPEAAKSPAAKSQKNPLVAILLVFNMLALGAVAFMQYQFMEMKANEPSLTSLLKEGQAASNPDVADEQAPTEDLDKESLIDLETFTVNLAQGDGPRRYVRLNVVLKMSKDSDATEVQARKPQIRDTVISILNSKRPEDLLKRDGKIYLKEQVKSAINSYLIDGSVVDIFYVGFQIN